MQEGVVALSFSVCSVEFGAQLSNAQNGQEGVGLWLACNGEAKGSGLKV